MQPQPDTFQPLGQRDPHLPGLVLCYAMHHCIISEPLELHGRELALEPCVERVMHEEIREDGRDR